jgi:phospholipase C
LSSCFPEVSAVFAERGCKGGEVVRQWLDRATAPRERCQSRSVADTSGGFITNPPDYTVEFTDITTYPELLQAAGISWQVYTNHEVGDGGGLTGWVGDFGDNPLWFCQAYQTSMNATTPAGQQLAQRGAVEPWQPFEDVPLGPNHVNHVLADWWAALTGWCA